MSTYIYHYTYIIRNKITREYYIGRRSCNKLPSEDLGKCYFSSSTNKDWISFQKQYPQLFDYQIYKIFDNLQDMILSEVILHAIWQVKDDPLAINKSNATVDKFDCTGLKWTDEQRKAHSNRHKGKILSDRHKKNISNALTGIRRNATTCKRIQDYHIGRPKSYDIQQMLKQNSYYLAQMRAHGWYKVSRIYDRKVMCVGNYQQWVLSLQGYYRVTRVDTRKEMDLCQFMNWYKASTKVKAHEIMVTRLKDKKLLTLRQFKTWINGMNRQPRPSKFISG